MTWTTFFTMRACFWGMWDLLPVPYLQVDLWGWWICMPPRRSTYSVLKLWPDIIFNGTATSTCYLPDRNWLWFYGSSSLDNHKMMRLMVTQRFQSWVGSVWVHLLGKTNPRPPPFPTLQSSQEQPDLGGRNGCLGLGSGRLWNSIMRNRSVIRGWKEKEGFEEKMLTILKTEKTWLQGPM